MARITLSVSITPEQNTFLNKKGISASGLLQQEIIKQMQLENACISPEELGQLKEELESIHKKMEIWQKITYSMRDFMEKEKILDKYNNERGKNT